MLRAYHRDDVFVPGGQPSLTYVEREELHVERTLARGIAAPNQIVSLSGPTKTGKTVLCRKVLGDRQYVWIDGGQVETADELWRRVCSELQVPDETSVSETKETSGEIGGSAAVVTASGSRLYATTISQTKTVNSMADAIRAMLENGISLVVDDFHYLNPDARTTLMRNVKGAVFNGLKVILLSVTHRAFDAIKAESELTGRFSAITLPSWTVEDLEQIPILGFAALRVNYRKRLLTTLAEEAQESPFLMQKFCWEICFDCGIERTSMVRKQEVPGDYDTQAMFVRIAQDAGLPIYQKLAAGPQSRKVRAKRPLKTGNEADIYQATLLALAETGPKSTVTYDELRASFNSLLLDMVPQKHEITSALKHLGKISKQAGAESAIDWDEDKREVNVADPYLRFYLRWQVRQQAPELA